MSGSDERAVGEWHKVSYLTSHENFSLDTFEHDIGLIKVGQVMKLICQLTDFPFFTAPDASEV